MTATPTAVLLLADGTLLRGQAIGATGTTLGELCFNTGMTGYQEVFTDPSYYGQILIATHTHIGNYGTVPAEAESAGVTIAGLVVRNFSDIHSRPGAQASLQDYLAQAGVVGIQGLDTRALVRHIRSKGAMNAVISSELLSEPLLRERLAAHPDMNGLELASQVMAASPYWHTPEGTHTVAVMDYGVKQNILNSLALRGLRVRVYPGSTPAEQVLADQPDGVLLSNGPGDPGAMPYAVAAAQAFIHSGVPTFGICLGHQLLAQALGGRTYKMPYGHRGLNHPVQNLLTGRGEITTQNHGFAVEAQSVTGLSGVQVTHLNLNDQSVEGLALQGKPVFGVQYHPESNPGPHDSRYLFDQFRDLVAGT